MRDLTVIIHDDYVDDVVDSLHETGIAEISDVERDKEITDLIEPGGIPDIISKLTEYDMKLSAITEIFERLSDERSTVQEFTNPIEIEKIKREKKDFDEVLYKIDELIEKHGDHILNLEEKLNRTEERIGELRILNKNIKLMKDIDIDLCHVGESQYTVIRVGKTKNPHKFKKLISDLETSYHDIEKVNEEEYVVIAAAYIRDESEFESILRQGDVRPFDLEGVSGTPKKALDNINLKIKQLKDRRDDILDELKLLKEEHEKEYYIIKEELDLYREKKEVLQKFGNTDSSSVLKGWVPKKDVDKVEKLVEKKSDGCAAVITEKPDNPDEVPTRLDNPKFIKPFELLTHMFAPPKYDEIDPTFILAPAFVIFFGLMLGDAIYGLLIIITSVILLRGIGKVEKGTRDFAYLLLATGVSTVIFGILQGGYLGPTKGNHPNLLGRIGLGFINDIAILQTLEGEGPLILLIISLLIGLFYLNLGILLQFVEHMKKGHYRNIIVENLSWWTLQPGGFILLSGKLFGWYNFSYTVNIIAGILSVIGLILMVVRAKGLSFFELTGFLGDFLSFSRILALGLATSGIALTVNVLADLIVAVEVSIILTGILLVVGIAITIKGFLDNNKIFKIAGYVVLLMGVLGALGYLGIITPSAPFYVLGLFVIIGGHLANAVLQALGSFVHSLRLQYVEFFGYFYEGGGSSFTPFKSERKHTELEEEVIK
ncbi:MAG: V-type ATP synthase subunit I [Thermoplasmata archaeon]